MGNIVKILAIVGVGAVGAGWKQTAVETAKREARREITRQVGRDVVASYRARKHRDDGIFAPHGSEDVAR